MGVGIVGWVVVGLVVVPGRPVVDVVPVVGVLPVEGAVVVPPFACAIAPGADKATTDANVNALTQAFEAIPPPLPDPHYGTEGKSGL